MKNYQENRLSDTFAECYVNDIDQYGRWAMLWFPSSVILWSVLLVYDTISIIYEKMRCENEK